MSFSLPDTVVLPASPARHNIAIAEIAIFATILPIKLGIRYIQIRSQAATTGVMNPMRCFLRAWLNFIVVFAQIRIVGFALYLGVENPRKGVVISEVVLQSVGLSPLLLELSFILLRCGRAVASDERRTIYPRILERMLQYIRAPIAIAVVLIAVAGLVLNLSYLKAGALVLLAAYVYVTCIAIFIISRYQERLLKSANRGLRISVASLPLFAIRVMYLLLVEFGDIKFDPVIGDWRYLVGLGFSMEVGIVFLLVTAAIAMEPLHIRRKSDKTLPLATSINSAGVGH